MKKLAYTLAATAAIAVATPALAASPLTNPGFETGDLTGWTANQPGLTSVVSSFNSGYASYNPYQGEFFAVLSSGAGTNSSTVVSQLFNMTAGQTFAVAVAFAGADYSPFNDAGALGILNFVTSNNTVLFSKDIATVGDYGSTPWTVVKFTAPNDGTYYLSGNVKNVLDNNLNSYLLLDSASVPEASTWAMMILGIGAVGGMLRRRNQKARVNYSFA